MSAGEVVLDGERAVIFDRASQQALRCSVPTAIENVENGRGRYVHGYEGKAWDGPADPPVKSEPAVRLHEEGTLPLPDEVDDLADVRTTPGDSPEKLEAMERETDEANAAANVHPLDHDADGVKGGSKAKPNRSKDPEREAVKKALKAADIKFFGGATTEDLKKLLPG